MTRVLFFLESKAFWALISTVVVWGVKSKSLNNDGHTHIVAVVACSFWRIRNSKGQIHTRYTLTSPFSIYR